MNPPPVAPIAKCDTVGGSSAEDGEGADDQGVTGAAMRAVRRALDVNPLGRRQGPSRNAKRCTLPRGEGSQPSAHSRS